MPTPDPRPRHQSGADPLVTDGEAGRKKKAAWLLPLLLLLAILAAGAIFLIVRNAGDDNDKKGIDVTNDQGASANTTDPDAAATTTTAAGDTTSTVAPNATPTTGPNQTTTAPSSTSSGELSSGTRALLPPPASGLGDLIGDTASGTATVESVVADEGFWVGEGPGDRVFVDLSPEARSTTGESPFQVEAGQKITLDGTVKAAPADPSTLGVTEAEGGPELTTLGGYIEASKIELSK